MLNSSTINKTFFDRAFNYSYINELSRNLKFPRLFYITPYIYIYIYTSDNLEFFVSFPNFDSPCIRQNMYPRIRSLAILCYIYIYTYMYPFYSVASQRETLRFGWRGVSPHHFPRHRLYDPLVFILSSLYTRGNFLLTRIYVHDEEEGRTEGEGEGWLLDRWNEME